VHSALFLAVALVALVAVGALVALPALLPPVRRFARRAAAARWGTTFLFGALAFLVAFGLFTRLTAVVNYTFNTSECWGLDQPAPGFCRDLAANESGVVAELWARLALPPPLRRPCHAAAEVCALADVVAARAGMEEGWRWYLTSAALCAVSALAAGTVVLLSTQRGDR